MGVKNTNITRFKAEIFCFETIGLILDSLGAINFGNRAVQDRYIFFRVFQSW